MVMAVSLVLVGISCVNTILVQHFSCSMLAICASSISNRSMWLGLGLGQGCCVFPFSVTGDVSQQLLYITSATLLSENVTVNMTFWVHRNWHNLGQVS